jgi:hypothetical protein
MNKKGQFYLIAAIILVGLIVALSAAMNYSTKTNSNEAEEIAKELTIESSQVLDYDTLHPSDTQFENFAMAYSQYVGEDKDIYFIIVDENQGIKEAYKYSADTKVDLSSNLAVGSDIKFTIDSSTYSFKLEDGENFYFVIVQSKGGERYVLTG